ncbi:MAG: hypothetical protein ACI9MC_000172 [Kiritimatiellia bacterium]|jgi:hypothetical protein
MTCHHAETTTIAWLYGEGPKEHVHHVAMCETCQEVARMHSEVMSTIGPVLGTMEVDGPPIHSVVQAPPMVQQAANRPWGLVVAALVAVAAVALLASTPWLMAQTQPNDIAQQQPAPPQLAPVTPTPQIVRAPSVPDDGDPLAPEPLDEPIEQLFVSADDIPDGLDEMDQGLDDIFDELDAFEQDMLTL